MSKEKDKKDEYHEDEYTEEYIDDMNEILAELAYQYKDELDEYIDKYINNYEENLDEYETDDIEQDENIYYDEETNTQITDSPLYLVYEKYDLKDSELPFGNDENDYYELFEEMYKEEKYLKSLTYGEEISNQFSVLFKFSSTNFYQIYSITSSNVNDDKVMITKKRIKKINKH